MVASYNDDDSTDEQMPKRRVHPLFAEPTPIDSSPIEVPALYVQQDAPKRSAAQVALVASGVAVVAIALVWLLARLTAPTPVAAPTSTVMPQTDDQLAKEDAQNDSTLDQLQIARRDTQRKNDLALTIVAFEIYAADKEGAYPALSEATKAVMSQIKDTESENQNFIDPTTALRYQFVAKTPQLGQMQYVLRAECASDGSVKKVSSSRRFAVVIALEGEVPLHCLDNS